MELGGASEEEQSKIIEEVRKMRQQRLDTMNADFLAFSSRIKNTP